MNISPDAIIGSNVEIKCNTIVEAGAVIGDNCILDHNVVIKRNVHLGANCFVGMGCVLGEYLVNELNESYFEPPVLVVGEGAVIRSGTVIYAETKIGSLLQTGHGAVIREQVLIGNGVSVGTHTTVQDRVTIGNQVRLHSNVFVGELTTIGDHAWLFPHVVVTNDKTPPSHDLRAVTIEEYACICAQALLLPGITVGKDSLVGAGAVVTKDVSPLSVVVGNPARLYGSVEALRDSDGNQHYPWRLYYKRD